MNYKQYYQDDEKQNKLVSSELKIEFTYGDSSSPSLGDLKEKLKQKFKGNLDNIPGLTFKNIIDNVIKLHFEKGNALLVLGNHKAAIESFDQAI
jgi:hypothetical protein